MELALGRYEFVDGKKSRKFWEIEQIGDEYQVTFGRIGTGGVKQPRLLSYKEACKKITEKISKGYRHVAYRIPAESDLVAEPAQMVDFTTLIESSHDIGDSVERIKAALESKKYVKREATFKTSAKEVVEEAVEPIVEVEPIKESSFSYLLTKEVIAPSRCEAQLPDDLTKKYLIAEEKLDGSRYVLYCDCNPYERTTFNNSALLSRRNGSDGKFIDKSENVPHITGHDWESLGLSGTVLDGEIYAGRGNFLQVNSIMNSAKQRAVDKQKKEGNLSYFVFDIIKYRGRDVRGRPWHERRKILEHVIKLIDDEFINAVPYASAETSDIVKQFDAVVGEDGEGLIIKDSRSAYGIGWAKMKKSYDVSCIISGMKPGNGKNAATFGALALSVYDEESGKLVEVGFVSIQEDKLRQEVFDNFKKYEGSVIDVFAQEIQKKSVENPCGRLRHTSFHRFRDDIDIESITSTKLENDLKSRAKFGRTA